MFDLIVVVVIYTVVFGTDYLFYLKMGNMYNYVSRRTYILFTLGIIAVISTQFSYFQPYFNNLTTEIGALLVITVFMTAIAAVFNSQSNLICNTASRTERCLTPGYVWVKGADLVFQQVSYLTIGLVLVSLLGGGLSAYVSFIVILTIIHTPVVLSTNKEIKYLLTIGVAIFSIPFLYTYTTLGLFWPALYIHALAYVFIWMAFADMDPTLTVSDS